MSGECDVCNNHVLECTCSKLELIRRINDLERYVEANITRIDNELTDIRSDLYHRE